MAATADDLLQGLIDLNRSIDKLWKLEHDQATQRQQQNRQANQAAADQGTAARLSNPVGQLLGAYRSAGGATGNLFQAARSGNVTGALEGILGAGRANAAAAGAVGGGLAGAATGVGAIVGAGLAALEFKRALDNATRTTIEHYRELSRVSGLMAGVMAQRDVREMLRDREKGDRLAGVASELTRAEQDRKDAALPLELAWEELKGGFLVTFNETMADILRVVTDLLGIAELYAGKSEEAGGNTLGGMLQDIRRDYEQKERDHRAFFAGQEAGRAAMRR